MIPLQIHHLTPPLSISQTTPRYTRPSLPHLLSPFSQRIDFSLKPNLFTFSPILLSKPTFKLFRASESRTLIYGNEDEEATGISTDLDDLSPNGVVYRKTLALVECSMFAALTGLVYFLSNSLAIENYFACFFSLPIVITSMRWGIAAGRKTMVATTMLLLVLSGPLKASTYLLKHGLVGFTMGSLWRSRANWTLSVLLCAVVVFSPYCYEFFESVEAIFVVSSYLTKSLKWQPLIYMQVRALGSVGYVLITSFLIRENIFALVIHSPSDISLMQYQDSSFIFLWDPFCLQITINIHASLTFIFTAAGIYTVPSMEAIYALFSILVFINSASFTFLLHLLYAAFLSRLGMKASLRLPRWLEKAI